MGGTDGMQRAAGRSRAEGRNLVEKKLLGDEL